MSANASISEGNKGYPFGPVKCLMVEGDNGEFYPWYPEADRALDSLSVTQNGIYRASDRGVYGWNRVSVNVAQTDRVTGRDPDTGDEKTVTVDPGTGELVETVVPVEIRIETPPTFTGPYGDGANIDFTGLTVAAYGANGDKMLDVPFNELIFPVTVTDVSKVIGESSATSDLVEGAVPFASMATAIWMNGEYEQEITWDAPSEGAIVTGWNPNLSSNRIALITGAKEAFQDPDYQFTHGGKTVHYTTIMMSHFTRFVSVSPTPAVAWGASNIPPEYIWTAIYGTIQSGGQPIPVQWQCPDSGEILETSFNVEVVDVSPNNNSGN